MQFANDRLEDEVHARTRELRQANRELEIFSNALAYDVRAPDPGSLG